LIRRGFIVRLALFGAAIVFLALAIVLVHASVRAPSGVSLSGWIVLCNVIAASFAVGALLYSPYLKGLTGIGIIIGLLLLVGLIGGQLALDAWLYSLFGGRLYT
jgi:hypothetical protein